MDRVFDFNTVKDRPELVDGTYDFTIEGFTETQLGEKKLSALRLSLRVTAPATDVNLPWNENYFIGSENDPDGTDPQKLAETSGMRGLKRLGRACGLDMAQRWTQSNLTQAILRSGGFTAHLSKTQSKKDGKMYTNIDRYYKLGEVPTKHDGPAQATASRANGAAGVARPAPVAAARTAAQTTDLPSGWAVEE